MDDGGCPVREYQVKMSDPDSAATPTNLVNYHDIEMLYYARSLLVTEFPASSVGKRFSFLVTVFTDYAT